RARQIKTMRHRDRLHGDGGARLDGERSHTVEVLPIDTVSIAVNPQADLWIGIGNGDGRCIEGDVAAQVDLVFACIGLAVETSDGLVQTRAVGYATREGQTTCI